MNNHQLQHMSSVGTSFDSSCESEWPVNRKDYVLGDMIGSGATACVFEASCIPLDNRPCAIKRINLDRQNVNITELSNEIKMMSLCNHRNIVTYYTSFVHRHELWVVMRLLTKGSALDVIKHFEKTSERSTDGNGKKEPALPEFFIVYLLHEVLQGLDYLHKQGNIHRDVKAGNVLIGDHGEVQLADCGVSAWISASNKRSQGGVRHTFVGTPCWMAPEVIEQESSGYDWKVDIWSFGITAIELATGKAPYAKYPAMKVMMMTVQNDSPRLEQCCHDANVAFSGFKKCKLDNFIAECLQKDPMKRPTAAKLLKHEIFKKFQHGGPMDVVGSSSVGKDTKFMEVVDKLPHFKHRAQKVKRVPGSTGSMHRTEDGGWEWSDDELEPSTSAATSSAPVSSDSDPYLNSGNDISKRMQHNYDNNVLHHRGDERSSGASPPAYPIPNDLLYSTQGLHISPYVMNEAHEVRTAQPHKFVLCLRMRNDVNELNDIKFPFNSAEDSADSVAQEMVTAGLISGANKILLAHNIVKIIEGHVQQVLFKLNLPPDSREMPNAETFCGYAKLSLVE